MLSHSWFVLNILVGRNARWGPQPRGSHGIVLKRAIIVFAPHAMIAIATGAVVWRWTPSEFWWYLPLLFGPATDIILGGATSKPALGVAARRRGVFLVPSETTGVPIVDRVNVLLAEPAPSRRIMDEGIGRNSDALLTA